MVCPDDDRSLERKSRCVRLAGESPVAVNAGEPRSRLRSWGGIPGAERSVKSLRRVRMDPGEGSNVAGPMRKRESCSLVRVPEKWGG